MSAGQNAPTVPASTASHNGRVSPHDDDAERSVLGCMMLDGASQADTLRAVRAVVGAVDFYSPKHGAIFAAVCTVADRGDPPDPILVVAEVNGVFSVEGHELIGMVSDAAGRHSAVAHAKRVAELSRHRQVIEAGLRLVDAGYGGDLDRQREIITEISTSPVNEDEPVDMVPLIDWAQVHDPADDIVEGLVLPGRWVQFVAPAKEGKSSLLVWAATEVSEGRDPWDGAPVTPVKVLYCLGEMWRPDLAELIVACGHDPGRLANFHGTIERMRLDTEMGAARLLRRIDQLEPGVVILDGLNGFVAAEASENDDKTWRPLVRHTADPIKQRGIALVSADNMGKDPTRGSRGSSVKTDKADGVVAVRRTDNGTKLHVTHSRGGAYLSDDLNLEAEGFDRSRPIRFWRALGGWPAGTAAAAAMLDGLGVPVDESRRKVRARLTAEIDKAKAAGVDASQFRVANEVLTAALRYRRTPSMGTP